jgi:hypothetical protein
MPALEPQHFAALREMAAEAPIEVETTGSCMAPLIEDGVRVRVESRRTYWPGDVVVIRAANELRAHRLIGWVPSRSGWRLVTQADSLSRERGGGHDDPVRPDQVLGRVTGGECAPEVARIPLGARLRALRRFFRQIVRSLRHRIARPPSDR